jgi:nitroreductase
MAASQEPKYVPYSAERPTEGEMRRRSLEFLDLMKGRRTVRMFSTDPVPRDVIESLLETAGTAPSGAHKQPWTFVAIGDAETKRKIRAAAEEEEKRFYSEGPEDWLRDLAPLGTDWVKTHLTEAPWLVVVFAQLYGVGPGGEKRKHYYVQESVGIAVGFFLAAVRNAGLAALTHTPSPMTFLRDILGRPENERAYVAIPVGYPAEECKVPDIKRKPLDEFVVWR